MDYKSDIGININNVQGREIIQYVFSDYSLPIVKESTLSVVLKLFLSTLIFIGKVLLCTILMAVLLYAYFFCVVNFNLNSHQILHIIAGVSIAMAAICLWELLSLYKAGN